MEKEGSGTVHFPQSILIKSRGIKTKALTSLGTWNCVECQPNTQVLFPMTMYNTEVVQSQSSFLTTSIYDMTDCGIGLVVTLLQSDELLAVRTLHNSG